MAHPRLRLGIFLALVLGGSAAADTKAEQAVALCAKVEGASIEERADLLKRGLARADEAVAENDTDPVAHYAVFCNLGRQMEFERVSASTITAVRRIRKEVDRALELKPDYAEALMGKGSLLCNMPRLIGGDAKEGERLLRKALELEPNNVDGHLQLAKALLGRGAKDEARAEAQKALALAQVKPHPPQVAEARKLLAKLDQ
jgi:tetratricopeptide (TPR) repeat protein